MSNIVGQIDTFLKTKGSPLAGLGNVFVAAGKKYGVDPRLVVSISGIESSFGKHVPDGTHNAWGWGPGHPFGSWDEGIATVTKGLKNGYISQGLLTPAQIVRKYSPSSAGNDESNWSSVVSQFMHELGATPAAATARKIITPAAPPRTLAAVPRSSDLAAMRGMIEQLRSPSRVGLEGAARATLARVAAGGHTSGTDLLQNLVQGRVQDLAYDNSNTAQADALEASLQAMTPPPASVPVIPTSPQPGSEAPQISGVKPGNPIPTAALTSIGGLHQTEGLPGYPAHDFMAPAGTPVVAPVAGEITRLSGHPPSDGPTSGPHGPFGWSIYLKGDDGHSYYLTHLGTRDVQVGDKISAGQKIATVGDYSRFGGADHVHMGVH